MIRCESQGGINRDVENPTRIDDRPRKIQVDPPIAGQGLLVVLPKRIAGVPDDPTQFFVVVRTLPTAVDKFTMGVWHYTAISGPYRVCKMSRCLLLKYPRKYCDLREK